MPGWFRFLLALRIIYCAKRDGPSAFREPCSSPEVRRADQVYVDLARAELDAKKPWWMKIGARRALY